MHISDEHVEQWQRHGYTIVERFLSPHELAELHAELGTLFPTWDQYMADQYSASSQFYGAAPGGGYFLDTPALGEKLNLAGAHLDLIDFVERALGTREVLLTQSQVWGKYTSGEDFEQALHADYMNNSILFPSSEDSPEQVTIILYYTDIELDLGPTHVIPRDLTRDVPLVPYIRPRSRYGDFYANERPVLVPAGSLFLYDLRTFHRGSAMKRPSGIRLTITWPIADWMQIGWGIAIGPTSACRSSGRDFSNPRRSGSGKYSACQRRDIVTGTRRR
jgi:ectoine hydroxylase-related dioxygenase (phytanoyl-CoA dioxygenase family)